MCCKVLLSRKAEPGLAGIEGLYTHVVFNAESAIQHGLPEQEQALLVRVSMLLRSGSCNRESGGGARHVVSAP